MLRFPQTMPRLQLKYGLLTYSQCGDLDGWKVSDLLSDLGAECIVGREHHTDGGIHLHAFFMFEPRLRTSNHRIFDVDGVHPNLRVGYSNPATGYDYAIKDGDVVAGGLERPGESDVQNDSKWARIVAAEDQDEFWSLVRSLDPRALCINFTSLSAYANHRYAPERVEYRTPDGMEFDTSDVPDLAEWVDTELTNRGRGR